MRRKAAQNEVYSTPAFRISTERPSPCSRPLTTWNDGHERERPMLLLHEHRRVEHQGQAQLAQGSVQYHAQALIKARRVCC